jgi:Peptidase family M28/Secretion system C-terminal sorting domain
MKKISGLVFFIVPFFALAQTNMTITNSTALNILKGIYTPVTYNPASVSQLPNDIIAGIKDNISQDSIKKYWSKLGTFYNRSTGNQLASPTRGITATFNWIQSKFQEFSSANSNRLVVSDFTFDQTICSATSHKETFAVLPGNSLTDNSVLVFVAHADSRASASCTAAAVSAKGMEDNATGVSLVMELARVMSQFSYHQTIVFLVTTGEEQGLYGSTAFATYLHNNNIPVKTVINNDIVGSLYCLLPTNAVGCSVNNSVDSTSIRLFSGGTINSSSKAWARYIKMEYHENLQNLLAVPAIINIMTDIDREGRSGDHVPFYNLGAIAVRMCSFNEPGDGFGSGREHLSLDSGGVDTKPIPDGNIDSFFVSFSFLKRNAQVIGNAVGMVAVAPATPTYTVTNIGNNNLRIVINTQTGYPAYRLGVRTTSYDFDSVYTFTRLVDTLHMPVSGNLIYYVTAASQDGNHVESLFGNEVTLTGTASALAVEMTQFTASVVNDNDVLLQWKVADANIADTFDVERSEDAIHFYAIGSVRATSSYGYSFDDVHPLEGSSYYRLRMVQGNHYDFGPTADVVITMSRHTQVFPSPAHDYIIIKTKARGKSAQLADMQGRNFMKLTVSDRMRVDISNIPRGIYFLVIDDGEVVKFSKN